MIGRMNVPQGLIACLMCFASCTNDSATTQPSVSVKSEGSFKTIVIQPFIGLRKNDAVYIRNEIARIYPHTLLKDPIEFPSSAFNRSRNRYRADSLIHFLSNETDNGFITLGLTNKDISTTKGQVSDWGVMGLGYQPGKACIASTFRLSKTQTLDQLFKVSIHELGHAEGLPHCSDTTCFMQDAEGKNPTNRETRFCEKCKKHLVDRGWKFE